MKVYQAVNAVQGALSALGIGKDRKNTQQGFQFRGIDDVYNALAPLLAKHGLCILPRVISRECVERTSAKGGALFYVTVDVEFDFVSAEDGSKHTVRTAGEAMDSADKATNKAMSAAYKYACLQAFCIPTEGDNDADATTHELAARQVERQKWLDRQKALIFAAQNVGDLKKVVANAISAAMNEEDGSAVDQINAWAEEKKAQAKPKEQQ